MIVPTLRLVCRNTGAWQLSNSYVNLNCIKQLQGYRCFHGITRSSKEAVDKGAFSPMDWNKKRKSGTLVWRQISTQSSGDKGKNEIDEAEAMVVSPSSAHLNDVLTDTKDVLGDSSTTSVGQKTVEVQNAENVAVSKKKHAVSVEVGAPVIRFIKGKDGSTQKSIEEEMGVNILIPKYTAELKDAAPIVIEGDSMDDITKASQKIQSIINEAVKTSELIYSHFISFPLAIHPEFVDKMTKFQSSILDNGRTDDNSRADTSGDSGKVDQAEKVPVKVDRRNIAPVGAPVIRFIKGKDGSTQKSIEEEMGVNILIPKYTAELKDAAPIVIEGDSMDDITKASQKIQSIINEAVKTSELIYSHFISFPLAIHPEFVDKMTKFQSSILDNGRTDDNSRADTSGDSGKVDQAEKVPVKVDRRNIAPVSYALKATKTTTLFDLRIDSSLFVRPQRLHLTVLMLKCWNKERIHAAMDVLKSINTEVNEVLDNRPLFVRLEGLDLIRGTKPKAQVLYVPVKEVGDEGRLDRACQIISNAYSRAGFITSGDENRQLKFHVTVMNTTFRSGKRKGMKFDSFDARGIFEKFGSEDWGEYHIREAHLSQRFAYDDNDYYHCCASIPLPENIQAHEPPQAELEVTPMAESVSS